MEPNNHKRFILAVILTICVLFVWQRYYGKPKEYEYNAQLATYQKQKQAFEKKRQALEAKKATSPATAAVARRIPIKTPSVQGSITLQGARLDDLLLLDYKRTGPTDTQSVELLSPADKEFIYFAEFGWISNDKNITVPTASTIWSSSDTELSPEHPITLHWKNDAGIRFTIDLAVDNHYLFTVTKSITNTSNQPISVASYGIINRNHVFAGDAKELIIHSGPLAVHNGVLSEYSFDKMQKNPKVSFTGSTGWIGFTDKYWFTSIIPDQNTPVNTNISYYVRDLKERYQADYTGPDTMIAPGAESTDTVRFFAGAKQVSLLDAYAKQFNIPLFDRAVDFGWLYFITKPIFLALTYFHTLVGNFGIAILLLTVCIKTLLFPLAYKSYVSMHKMKQFQPQILALRERYTDNKLQLNKEIMALYKREKINPASGCLPILIQIPIFFALYRVLLVTIEMRHAPFFGWIHDLSAPDPTSVFNVFGLLPYNVPPVLQFGVWPLVMGITMYLQQRVNPQPTDPVQAKIFKFFPLIFTFMLYRFPAGLVIYWAWNNTLTILQQQLITLRLSRLPKTEAVHG